MTNAQVADLYQSLISEPGDVLAEVARGQLASAAPDLRARAQQWIDAGDQLAKDEIAMAAAHPEDPESTRVPLRLARRRCYAVAICLVRGAVPAQLDGLEVPPEPAPAAPDDRPAEQGLVEGIKLAIEGSKDLLLPEVWAQVSELLRPTALAVMGGVFAAWAVSHAFGVGEIADLLLVVAGAVTIGWDAVHAARLFYAFVNHCRPGSSRDIPAASREFAQFVSLVGVDIAVSILLGKAFSKVREKLPGKGGKKTTGSGGEIEGEKAGGEKAAEKATAGKTGAGDIVRGAGEKGAGDAAPDSQLGLWLAGLGLAVGLASLARRR